MKTHTGKCEIQEMISGFVGVARLTISLHLGLLSACIVLLSGCSFFQSPDEPSLEPLAKTSPSPTLASSTATPSPIPTPTATPTPTPTATPSPTPEPTCIPNSGQLTSEQEKLIADLPWAQDSPSSVRELQRLAIGSPVAFRAWMHHFGDDEVSWPPIRHYASIAFCDEATALRILQMPFLDQVPVHAISVERDNAILRELSRLARSSLDDLEAVLSHPELQGGITDTSEGSFLAPSAPPTARHCR